MSRKNRYKKEVVEAVRKINHLPEDVPREITIREIFFNENPKATEVDYENLWIGLKPGEGLRINTSGKVVRFRHNIRKRKD